MAVSKTRLEQLDDEMNQMTVSKDKYLLSYRLQMKEKRKEKKELMKTKIAPPEVINSFERKVKRNREEKRKEDDKLEIQDESNLPNKRIEIDSVDEGVEVDNAEHLKLLSEKVGNLTLKNEDNKGVEKAKLLCEEIEVMIDKYKDKPNPPTYHKTILLKEPNDEKLFDECVRRDRQHRETKHLVIEKNQTYTKYWYNNITCFEDVKKVLDDVIKLEKKRTRVKISTTFGLIYETFENDPETNAIEYKYHVYSPNDVDEANRHLINLIDPKEIERYKQYLEARIRDSNEISSHLDSKTLYIAIHKMQINCWYSSDVGRKGTNCALVHNMCSNHNAFNYEGEYDLCWFSIYAYYKHYVLDKEKKAFNCMMNVQKLAVEAIKKFYGITDESRCESVKTFLKEYPGFRPEEPYLTDDIRNLLLNYKKVSDQNKIRRFRHQEIPEEELILDNPDGILNIDRFIDVLELSNIRVWSCDERRIDKIDSTKIPPFYELCVYESKKHPDNYINIAVV
jgi:hypothetical protein